MKVTTLIYRIPEIDTKIWISIKLLNLVHQLLRKSLKFLFIRIIIWLHENKTKVMKRQPLLFSKIILEVLLYLSPHFCESEWIKWVCILPRKNFCFSLSFFCYHLKKKVDGKKRADKQLWVQLASIINLATV